MSRFHTTENGNVPFTAEEESAADVSESAWTAGRPTRLWIGVRQERDRLLAESDYSQLPDVAVDAAAWAGYRQQLRDLPTTVDDPADPTWPTQPEI